MRKAEILVAAEQLFQHYGFSKTTVADIAREAGIGVGTVYLEFSSKDAISGALCRGHRETVLESMREVIKSDGSFSERLVQLIETRLDGLHTPVSGGLHGGDILFAACAATRAVNEAYAEAEVRLLSEFLEAGNEAGAFTVADAPTTASILLQVYDTVIPPRDEGSTTGQRDRLATLHALVLGGVLSRMI
jgi:AcrR family transcriptional regulator